VRDIERTRFDSCPAVASLMSTTPPGRDKVFLSRRGAGAVEDAIKLARRTGSDRLHRMQIAMQRPY